MKVEQATEFNTRLAGVGDLTEIVRLAVELATQHIKYDAKRFDLADFEPRQETYRQYFAEQLKDGNARILIAEIDGVIVGYAFLRFEAKSFLELLGEGAWLHDIYFYETVRGKGIGRQFFAAIIAEAKALGSNNLMLSVSPHNTNARNFFSQLGFRPTMIEMQMDF